MTGAVVVAIVAGVLGLVTSLWVQQRQSSADRQLQELRASEERRARQEERQVSEKERLDAFREPLLQAADDLAHRISNIREKSFLVYLSAEDRWRRNMALLGTLYRFGKYWATVEALYRQVNAFRFETADDTKAIADRLAEIGTTFASSKYGSELMIWREEQRAIAELLLSATDQDRTPVMGFASFVDCYEDRLKKWFEGLESGLLTPDIEENPRLADLQRSLQDLVHRLEAGREYTVWKPYPTPTPS